MNRPWQWLFPALCLLAACSSQAPRHEIERARATPPVAQQEAQKPALKRGGGFYQDDGPGENPPQNLDVIPDAQPKLEPLSKFANRPYSVLGRDYLPMTRLSHYQARGMASWYGRKYNGQKTSNGETYDMYAMSAAHPTLPIPSYVRVSNPVNGKSVVVRVNDRGPFLGGRLIDLSFTAAAKLGILGNGSALVDVASVFPGEAQPTAKPEADPIEQIASLPEPSPPAPLPELQDAHGVYLQLGAFSNPDNAENLKSRLGRELGDLADKLVISSRGGIYRLNIGPWRDHVEAQKIALRMQETFELKPVMVRQ